MAKRRRGNAERLACGLVVASGFAAFWALGGHSAWAVFAAIFAGLLPAAKGLSGLISEGVAAPSAKRIGDKERDAAKERAVLKSASGRGGILTPPSAALDCDLSVEEAEGVLDGLARKGYASLRVREDGRIEYEFAEFMPRTPGS